MSNINYSTQCTSPGECMDEEANLEMEILDETQMENYKIRLRKELVSRDGHSEIEKDTKLLSLNFKDSNLEKAYSEYREPFSSIPLTASLLVHVVGMFYSMLVLPRYNQSSIQIPSQLLRIPFFLLTLLYSTEHVHIL